MSARRLSEKQLSIPQNTHFLDFERSDGDSGKWPTDTTEIVDSEGQVNFMMPLELDSVAAVRWRLGVAQGLSVALNLPGENLRSHHKSMVLTSYLAGPIYALRDWPEGYAFYDHHKGKSEDPRHDIYLFGVYLFPLIFFVLIGCFYRFQSALPIRERVHSPCLMANARPHHEYR